jgi:hypothetical protein
VFALIPDGDLDLKEMEEGRNWKTASGWVLAEDGERRGGSCVVVDGGGAGSQ